MNNHFFDESVREKLDGHQAPVPADAWANIQKGKKKRRPFPFFWLLLLLCGAAGLYLVNKTGAGTNTITAENSTGETEQHTASKKGVAKNTDKKPGTLSQQNNSNTTDQDSSNNKTGIALPPASHQAVKENDAAARNGIDIKNSFVNETSDKNNSKKKSNYGNNRNVNQGVADDNSDEPGDVKGVAKKKERSTGSKVSMNIITPAAEEDSVKAVVSATSAGNYLEDTILSKEDKAVETIVVKDKEKQKDSLLPEHIALPDPGKKSLVTKKKNAGLVIDLSLSGFMPAANTTVISMVSRITVEPLHRSAFTASKVRVRLQPSVGFNLLLFKSLSAKAAIGTGVSYQVIKEYIQLYGSEINTNYTPVKRLDGNVLVDDTVTTVTNGMRNIDAVNSYTLFSIPVSFRYRVLQRSQWTMDLQAGIDINLQSNYKNSIGGELVPQLANGGNNKRNKSIGTGFNAGVRLSRRLNKNFLVYTAPYLQLNPATLYLKEMLAPRRIQRVGISFGISYGL